MKPVHRLLFHWFVCLSMMLGFYHSLNAQSPASGVSKEQYVGEWNYLNTSDDSRAAQYFASSGALREKGEDVGTWRLVGEHLIVTYKHHP